LVSLRIRSLQFDQWRGQHQEFPDVILLGAVAQAALPASDLARARAFYAENLGLEPVRDYGDALEYALDGGGSFIVFKSGGASSGAFTQMAIVVPDLELAMSALRNQGVVFEEYDYPGFKTVNGIAERPYGRDAWFVDSEGNLLNLFQAT